MCERLAASSSPCLPLCDQLDAIDRDLPLPRAEAPPAAPLPASSCDLPAVETTDAAVQTACPLLDMVARVSRGLSGPPRLVRASRSHVLACVKSVVVQADNRRLLFDKEVLTLRVRELEVFVPGSFGASHTDTPRRAAGGDG